MAQYEIDNIPSDIDWECNKDIVKRTVQNAKNLLMLRQGEAPYDRLRGFDETLLHRPVTEIQAELLPELDRLMLWEPDVEVVSATIDADSVIRCVVELPD